MKMMFRSLVLLLVLPVIALVAIQGGYAQDDSPGEGLVYVTEIDDDIKAGTALMVNRAISEADEAGADYLIIELDTPGGLLQSTRDITDAMLATDTEVVIHVHKPGGWAMSAGTIMLLAADTVFINPTASIGAAEPFSPGEEPGTADEKAKEATISWVRGLAERNDRDTDIAEAFVADNLTLSGREAVELGVADGLAENLDDVLTALDIEGASVERVEPSLVSSIYNTLSNPFLVSLFLTLGGLTLVMSIRTGEVAFSTAIGAVLLLIGLWGIGIIEFSVIAIGLLVLGVLLLMIELFDQPGFGLFGVGGIISIIAGAFTLSQEPFYSPRVMDTLSLAALGTLLVGIVVLVIVGRAIAKTIKSPSVTGAEALIGREARVTEALDPNGRVKIDGESWKAKTADDQDAMRKNTRCTIIGITGNTLIVEAISEKESA